MRIGTNIQTRVRILILEVLRDSILKKPVKFKDFSNEVVFIP